MGEIHLSTGLMDVLSVVREFTVQCGEGDADRFETALSRLDRAMNSPLSDLDGRRNA